MMDGLAAVLSFIPTFHRTVPGVFDLVAETTLRRYRTSLLRLVADTFVYLGSCH